MGMNYRSPPRSGRAPGKPGSGTCGHCDRCGLRARRSQACSRQFRVSVLRASLKPGRWLRAVDGGCRPVARWVGDLDQTTLGAPHLEHAGRRDRGGVFGIRSGKTATCSFCSGQRQDDMIDMDLDAGEHSLDPRHVAVRRWVMMIPTCRAEHRQPIARPPPQGCEPDARNVFAADRQGCRAGVARDQVKSPDGRRMNPAYLSSLPPGLSAISTTSPACRKSSMPA